MFDAIEGLHSLLFPVSCLYCGKVDVSGCEPCLAQWRNLGEVRVISSTPILSAHPYDDRAMRIVLAAKERGERDAKGFLITAGSALIDRVATDSRKYGCERMVIVPIPSSTSSRRRRGEDFMAEIAKSVIERSQFTVELAPILTWIRHVADQSSLSIRERSTNVVGALAVDERSLMASKMIDERCQLVIIDDVLTSGATMAAAISAISHSSLGPSSRVAGITACYSVNPLFA